MENFTPQQIYPPGEITSGTHWVGGWLGHGAGVGLWTGITKYFLNAINLFKQEEAVSSLIFEMGTLKTQRWTNHYVYRYIVPITLSRLVQLLLLLLLSSSKSS
jgi:hypothetical protein